MVFSHTAEVHDGTSEYICKYCQQSFEKRSALDSHVSHFHESGPILDCPVCGVKHPEKKMLKHLNYAHTAEESVQCEICLKVQSEIGDIIDVSRFPKIYRKKSIYISSR